MNSYQCISLISTILSQVALLPVVSAKRWRLTVLWYESRWVSVLMNVLLKLLLWWNVSNDAGTRKCIVLMDVSLNYKKLLIEFLMKPCFVNWKFRNSRSMSRISSRALSYFMDSGIIRDI